MLLFILTQNQILLFSELEFNVEMLTVTPSCYLSPAVFQFMYIVNDLFVFHVLSINTAYNSTTNYAMLKSSIIWNN
jgi:hypothetical protein